MNRDFIYTAHSSVHGTGVFAKQLIPKGTRVIEYLGKRMSVAEYTASQKGSDLIYGFTADGITVIDGRIDGNDARFINHSCEPNCEAISFERERIYLYAINDIVAGAELSFDYQLGQANSKGELAAQAWACRCGTPKCRGSLLAGANVV